MGPEKDVYELSYRAGAANGNGSSGKLPASQILENLCLYLEGRFLIREPLILVGRLSY